MFRGCNGAVLGIKRSRSLAAAEVGRADSGQHFAPQAFSGKGAGATQHHAGYDGFRGALPQGHTSPPVNHAGKGKHFFGFFEPAQGEIGQVGFGIAADEIKNAVPARIGAGSRLPRFEQGRWREGGA